MDFWRPTHWLSGTDLKSLENRDMLRKLRHLATLSIRNNLYTESLGIAYHY